MSHILLADERFVVDQATLVAYHCAAETADWNLELMCGGRRLCLAGTITPGPGDVEALAGAEVEVELRSLDEVLEALLGRAITVYPDGEQVCALSFRLLGSPAGVRFAVTCRCDWDSYHKSFPNPGTVELTLAIDAVVAALHPGRMPE